MIYLWTTSEATLRPQALIAPVVSGLFFSVFFSDQICSMLHIAVALFKSDSEMLNIEHRIKIGALLLFFTHRGDTTVVFAANDLVALSFCNYDILHEFRAYLRRKQKNVWRGSIGNDT